jgi:hypothetical protein
MEIASNSVVRRASRAIWSSTLYQVRRSRKMAMGEAIKAMEAVQTGEAGEAGEEVGEEVRRVVGRAVEKMVGLRE